MSQGKLQEILKSKVAPGGTVRGGTPIFHPNGSLIAGRTVSIPHGMAHDAEDIKKAETIPEGTLKAIKKFIKGFTPIAPGSALILRHATPRQVGKLWTPNEARETGRRLSITGTVLKVRSEVYMGDKELTLDIKPGDTVGFSPYGPFAAYPAYDSLQLLHVDELLFKLDHMPEGAENPFDITDVI